MARLCVAVAPGVGAPVPGAALGWFCVVFLFFVFPCFGAFCAWAPFFVFAVHLSADLFRVSRRLA